MISSTFEVSYRIYMRVIFIRVTIWLHFYLSCLFCIKFTGTDVDRTYVFKLNPPIHTKSDCQQAQTQHFVLFAGWWVQRAIWLGFFHLTANKCGTRKFGGSPYRFTLSQKKWITFWQRKNHVNATIMPLRSIINRRNIRSYARNSNRCSHIWKRILVRQSKRLNRLNICTTHFSLRLCESYRECLLFKYQLLLRDFVSILKCSLWSKSIAW